jgi:hypothetical protein
MNVINSLKIVTTSICKIPPDLPFLREELPLLGRRPIGPLARRAKRGKGRFSNAYVNSIMKLLINDEPNPLEEWNDGMVEKWVKKSFLLGLTNLPLFQVSIIPELDSLFLTGIIFVFEVGISFLLSFRSRP